MTSPLHDPRSAQTPDGVDLWVREVLDETALASHRPTAVEALRPPPKRLAVVELATGARLVLKQYRDQRGAWTARWLHRLTAAGFTAPALHAVTPALGWSARHQTLVTEAAPGRPWTTRLFSSAADSVAAAAAVADWLTGLQALTVPLPDRTGYRSEQELSRQAGELGARFPRDESRLGRVVAVTRSRLYAGPPAPTALVCAHGDLHPENLFLDHPRGSAGPLGVTAIDVDTAGARRRSYDVGYALAQLLVVS